MGEVESPIIKIEAQTPLPLGGVSYSPSLFP
jgi:hypothetical protein